MHVLPNLESFIHFVGIGGIGMSGLAEILHNKGFLVKGSDLVENSNVRRLKGLGIPVSVGHNATNIRSAQVLVISSAVSDDNPEVLAARQARIPIITRGEMLAEIVRLKKTIAISGMHGKTTTTSMIASLLNAAAFEPTIINGGIINKLQTNARLGGGEWFVVEADESDGSFLKMPSIINVALNIDREHMTFFKTQENLEECFHRFINNVPFYGASVVCSDDVVIQKILSEKKNDRRLITYGLTGEPNIKGENLRVVATTDVTRNDEHDDENNIGNRNSNKNHGILFDVVVSWSERGAEQLRMKDVYIPMFGSHNVSNALAGIAVAVELGIDEGVIKQALADFSGVKRRFSVLGTTNGVTFIDDYAHHPSEIKAVIAAARQTGSARVVVVFQPHRYTRLADLWMEFLQELALADVVIAMPVYTAGESEIAGVNSKAFAWELAGKYSCEAHYAVDVDDAADLLRKLVKGGDCVIGMGAGSISEYIHALAEMVLGNFA